MSKVPILKQFGAVAAKLSRQQLWWLVGGLALLVLLAYGQTLGMYFWQDDAALVFKMQHPLPNAGSFGSGYFGVGAYKYLATPFIPLYPLFGMNPLPYFAVGLLIYFILTLTVFWFVRKLTQSNRIATSAAVLFGAGYFAQLAIFRLINSYQTNLSVILALLTFGVLITYYLTRRWQWYVGAMLLFAATLELMLVRSHGLILPVVALEVLFFADRFSFTPGVSVPKLTPGVFPKRLVHTAQQLGWAILRLIPFALIYKFFYLGAENQSSGGAIQSLIQTYIDEGKWENFLGLAASFGNMLIPDVVIKWFSELTGQPIGPTNWSHLLIFGIFLTFVWLTKVRLKFHRSFAWLASLAGLGWLAVNIVGARAQYSWYTDFAMILAGTIGGLAIIYFTFVGLYLWKRQPARNAAYSVAGGRLIAIAILFSVVWSVANYFGYFVLYPTSIMTSVSRYIMHSFVATVALWAILIELLVHHRETAKHREPTWLPTAVATALLALVSLSLTIADQQEWVEQKSQPTRAFYERMQELYPKLEYGALIWYDTKRDAAVEYAFGDIFSVGSMPDETALAIYYGIDRYDLKLSSSANNFLGEAYHWKKPLEMLYTFYYDGTTLHDTTPETRAAFAGELAAVDVAFDGVTGTPQAEVGTSTPVILDFDLDAAVKPAAELQASGQWPGKAEELPQYFQYIHERDKIRKQLKVDVSSEWSGAEKEFLTDGDYEKGWAAHRTIWPVEGHATVTVEFPQTTEVSRVLWANSHTIRTPIAYTIETSIDGTRWTTVKEVADGKERPTGELVTEDFEPITARFVRMKITQTATKEAPGLIEFEVVPTQFGRLDPSLAKQLQETPLIGAQDEASKRALAEYLEDHQSATVTYQTDRASHALHELIAVSLSSASGHYSVTLPASGTRLEEVKVIAPDYLTNLKVENARISFPTLAALEERGFIERRSKN